MKQKKVRIYLAGMIAAMSLATVNPVNVFAASDAEKIKILESEKADL